MSTWRVTGKGRGGVPTGVSVIIVSGYTPSSEQIKEAFSKQLGIKVTDGWVHNFDVEKIG